MSSPKVSVIIPAYGGAEMLRDAIQSVLDQSFLDFEIVVVDDVSPDHTREVVRQFDDPRIKYVLHSKNRGAIAARNTGFQTAVGEIIAFLDQDDLFHPDKLQTHVDYLAAHPEIGATYNARFDIEASSKKILGMWHPPDRVTLADLVLGFPFAPSDTVIRREWAQRKDIWDERFVHDSEEVIFNGGEIVFGGRLYLAGCRFASVGRALNYRRYHSQRILSRLESRCRSECACQDIILSDSRCPPEVKVLRNQAFKNSYLIWSCYALAQDELETGFDLARKAIRLEPSLVEGTPCELVKTWLAYFAQYEHKDHEMMLNRIFSDVPLELANPWQQRNWAVARGYMLRAVQSVLWDNATEAQQWFAEAVAWGAVLDEPFIQSLAHQVMQYEEELGEARSSPVILDLKNQLRQAGFRQAAKRLEGCYHAKRAFRSYRQGHYRNVPREAARAMLNDPNYIANRGLIAVAARSLFAR